GDASAGDERRVRPIPALHDPDVNLGRTYNHAVECGARDLPQGTAPGSPAVRDETRGRAGSVEDPKRRSRGRYEIDEQCKGELGGDRRRELSELLARERTPEDREGGGLGRHSELECRLGYGSAGLARLEAMVDGYGGDRVAEKVERCTLPPAVG